MRVDEEGMRGASPRVRGKRERRKRHSGRTRCIPACAGEAVGETLVAVLVGVHPRVCGGSWPVLVFVAALAGASPRVRGKQRLRDIRAARRGCIPACAGEAWSALSSRSPAGVHPGVCGGSAVYICGAVAGQGASPRVRGKPRYRRRRRSSRGCIPACAGEARGRRNAPQATQVHPRVCGGSDARRARLAQFLGASPRVRGKRACCWRGPASPGCIPACAGEATAVARRVDAALAYGCIPACAGEAAISAGLPRSARVHPRVCGGSHEVELRRLDMEGASPRVRGKPLRGLGAGRRDGCIPACAGEAASFAAPVPAVGVHPRVCGGS